jgi:hypothetical protein
MNIDSTQLCGAAAMLHSFLEGQLGTLLAPDPDLRFAECTYREDTMLISGAIEPTLAKIVGFLVAAISPTKPLSFHENGPEYRGLRESILDATASVLERDLVLPGTSFVLPDHFEFKLAEGLLEFDPEDTMTADELNAALGEEPKQRAALGAFNDLLARELKELLVDADDLVALLDRLDEMAQPPAA